MKFLITGGAGFIGSAVIRHIIQNTQDELVNLDKLTCAGNFLEAVRHYWKMLDVEMKLGFHFHHISKDDVYGDQEHPEYLFTEQTSSTAAR